MSGEQRGAFTSRLRRLRSRLADAYWEVRYRLDGSPQPSPESQTRLLARLDQALAANRDRAQQGRMIVCDDPTCQPYGEHYKRLQGEGEGGDSTPGGAA